MTTELVILNTDLALRKFREKAIFYNERLFFEEDVIQDILDTLAEESSAEGRLLYFIRNIAEGKYTLFVDEQTYSIVHASYAPILFTLGETIYQQLKYLRMYQFGFLPYTLSHLENLNPNDIVLRRK